MLIRSQFGLGMMVIVTGMAFAGMSESARGDVIVGDTFSLINGRAAGSNLAGVAAESGVGTWKSTSGSVTKFSSAGTIGNGGTAKGVISARIAISAPATIEQVSIVTTPGNSDWVGVGFLTADTASGSVWFGSTDTQVWFYVRPTGGWEIYMSGLSTKLGSGTLTGLASDWATTAHTLTLQYNPATLSINALVDGISLTNGWKSTGSAALNIGAAGFYVNPGGDSKPATTASIDSFEVATVPEIASLPVIGMGVLMVAATRR